MSSNTFVTDDGITLEYFIETQTLKYVRHWRDYPNTDRCEASFMAADGMERRWYALPLAVQGRPGHRYRLCWARPATMAAYELVGGRNLSTGHHRLTNERGLVAGLFAPAHYGRWAFCFSVLATTTSTLTWPSLIAAPGWAWLIAVPPVVGVVGLCASWRRNRRDPNKTFDNFVLSAINTDREHHSAATR